MLNTQVPANEMFRFKVAEHSFFARALANARQRANKLNIAKKKNKKNMAAIKR